MPRAERTGLGLCLQFLPFTRRGRETYRAPGHLQTWVGRPGPLSRVTHAGGCTVMCRLGCASAPRPAPARTPQCARQDVPARAGPVPSTPEKERKEADAAGWVLPTDPEPRATLGHTGRPRGDKWDGRERATDLLWARTRGDCVVPHTTARQLWTQPRVSPGPQAARQQQGQVPPPPHAPTPGLVAPFEAEVQGPGVGDPSLSLPQDLLATYRPC